MQGTRAALRCVLLVTSLVIPLLGFGATASATPADPIRPIAGCTPGPGSLTPGTHLASRKIAGVTRTYRIHVPRGHLTSRPVPLIIAYHGHAERSANFAQYTGLSRLPAIVVYPDGLRGRDGRFAWQGAPYSSPRSDDVTFTRAILADLRARACVDPQRTFAVGRSNGGGLVAQLACRIPDNFAAFAVVNAAVYSRSVARCANRPISLVSFHGTNDEVIRYDGGVRFGSRYLSVAEFLDRWARVDACLPASVVTPVNRYVDRVDRPICAALGHNIVHYRIRGGSHRWPGSSGNRRAGSISDTISASALMWQFFQAHPKRS